MIRSERNVLVGCHVTREIKDGLEQLRRQGKSMSEFMAKAIEEKLAREFGNDKEQTAAA